ncbi:MAG: hypothetical protein OJF52_003939 [Nitrospira sp.]|jgi:hypothetical protein|nr:MAG: hypothetical protein OJF52_003939 [Nitrospira sp.]
MSRIDPETPSCGFRRSASTIFVSRSWNVIRQAQADVTDLLAGRLDLFGEMDRLAEP